VAFRLYDLNDDGYITQDEVAAIIKLMVGTNLSDEQINRIAYRTLKDADAVLSLSSPLLVPA
jgi:Ca2+-binding EF-hand superfamily protein